MANLPLTLQSELDVLEALELFLLVTHVNLTKRCLAHYLGVQAEINRVGGSFNVKLEEFLAEIVTVLEATRGTKRKGLKTKGYKKVVRTDVVSDMDLQRFYSGAHTTWAMANKIYDALEGWPEKIDEDRVRRMCWEFYLKEKKGVVTKKEWLSPECTYRLFLIYNKLLLRDDTTNLEVGQLNAFLRKMVSVAQYTWKPHLEYKSEGKSDFVEFPGFVTAVTEYFQKLHLTTDLTFVLILEMHEILVQGILKKGFLVKKGYVVENWKRRFFVLQMPTLSYYKDKNRTKFKKSIMLNRHTKIRDVKDVDSPNHPNMFIVTCGVSEREFEICADDKLIKQSWILAIQKALSLTKMHSPLDREEFMTSLTQWRRSVCGDDLSSFVERRPPSETILLQQQVTDEAMRSLVENRSSVSSSLSQNSQSSSMAMLQSLSLSNDGYVTMEIPNECDGNENIGNGYVGKDTGRPSKGPSKDDSDINGRDRDKMSKEEQRISYPYKVVKFHSEQHQDTGGPSEVPSKDNSDISGRDRDKVSKEEQRIPYPYEVVRFHSEQHQDTGGPSEGHSKDNSDISGRDDGILLGKMSKEEQRRRYPFEFVNVHCKHRQERRTQDGFLSKKSPRDSESVQWSDTSWEKGTTDHVYVNSPVQGSKVDKRTFTGGGHKMEKQANAHTGNHNSPSPRQRNTTSPGTNSTTLKATVSTLPNLPVTDAINSDDRPPVESPRKVEIWILDDIDQEDKSQ